MLCYRCGSNLYVWPESSTDGLCVKCFDYLRAERGHDTVVYGLAAALVLILFLIIFLASLL